MQSLLFKKYHLATELNNPFRAQGTWVSLGLNGTHFLLGMVPENSFKNQYFIRSNITLIICLTSNLFGKLRARKRGSGCTLYVFYFSSWMRLFINAWALLPIRICHFDYSVKVVTHNFYFEVELQIYVYFSLLWPHWLNVLNAIVMIIYLQVPFLNPSITL